MSNPAEYGPYICGGRLARWLSWPCLAIALFLAFLP